MPAQKRHRSPQDDTEESPPPRSPPPSPGQQHGQHEDQQQQGGGAEHAAPQPELTREQEPAEVEKDDSDDEDDSPPSPASSGKPRFVLVRLTDVRKEVQCPICLGIIRKTRTVMECLHRFCRECIDKSMRLGNNECPACRTHCASRRSLRDDPNYDNLIAILYPDIDKYEKEELALHEEEKMRNRKIQASIAETHRRQSEALGRRRSTAKATATAFPRRSHGNFRNAHGQSSYFRGRIRSGTRNASIGGSDDEEEDDDVNGNDGGKDSSSAEEQSPDVRPKRCRRWAPPRSSPARIAGNAEIGSEENDDTEVSRENLGTSPFRAGNREMLAWGKGGARSQTRHGNASASNGRFVKGGRITKLVEYLRNLDENDDEFDVHCTVLPLNEQSVPHLQRPHLCSPSTLTIGQLSEFIALETQCCLPSEVEIFVRRPVDGSLSTKPSCEVDQVQSAPSKELQILTAEETLADLYASLTANQGGLLLLYKFKITETEMK